MSNEAYNLTLPLPPSINNYWGLRLGVSSVKKKQIPMKYVTHAAKDYRSTVENIILKEYPNFHPLEGDLQIAVLIHPANRRKEDIDNRLKPLLDALQGVLYEDDAQIKTLRAELLDPEPSGCILVTLMEK